MIKEFRFDLQRFTVFAHAPSGEVKEFVTVDDLYSHVFKRKYWIYGFKITKNESDPSARVTYTDDCTGFAPMSVNLSDGTVDWGSWENNPIIESFRPVALKFDGTVDYELDHNDHTKKLDGTASDISDVNYAGNFMVGVKKMYFYCYEDSNYEYCKVSNYQVDSNYKCYAHINDNGDIVNEIYLPMFEGYKDSNNRLRSIAGVTPCYSTGGAANEITWAKNNGSGWYIDDFGNTKMIENLLILLTKSCNNQATLGRGFVDGNSTVTTTGALKDKGMFWGNTGGKTSVKFLYLENYYGSRWDRIAGCINNNGTYYVKPSRPYIDETTFMSGYINTSLAVPSTSGGYQSAHTMTEYGLLPKTCSGSESTYIPDGMWSNNSQQDYALRGGRWDYGSWCGVSCLNVSAVFSLSYATLGASPCYK